MLAQLFNNDLSARVYTEREFGEGDSLRVPPLNQLKYQIGSESARLVVGKPIVESQRAAEILDYFAELRSIWMYRDYADVSRSSDKRFSRNAAVRNLRAIGDTQAPQTFASENVSEYTRDIVRRLFSENMSGSDAHALFWYVRNRIYFEQNLDSHDRVMLCGYEDFVEAPEARLREIYAFIGCDFPGAHLVRGVHTRSVKSRPLENLSEPVAELCDELQAQLRAGSAW